MPVNCMTGTPPPSAIRLPVASLKRPVPASLVARAAVAAAPAGARNTFDEVSGFVTVPATAGAVSVAVPLVAPGIETGLEKVGFG